MATFSFTKYQKNIVLDSFTYTIEADTLEEALQAVINDDCPVDEVSYDNCENIDLLDPEKNDGDPTIRIYLSDYPDTVIWDNVNERILT